MRRPVTLGCVAHICTSEGLPCIGDGASAQANSCGIAVPCQHNSADTEFEFDMLDERQKTATHICRRKSTGINIDQQGNTPVQRIDNLNALHYALPKSASWLVVGLEILTGGSTLHHCQSVIEVLLNSAMLPENLPTPPLAASWYRLHEPSNRRTLFTISI